MTDAPGRHDPTVLPPDLPVPQDDGAAAHLPGLAVPDIALPATVGPPVSLARLGGRSVLYIYPRTGVPGVDMPPGWNDIPGARGCTPQACGFRDHYATLRSLGVAHVFGLSTQDTAYQREAATRLHLPFALLSDATLAFARALRLPTFSVAGMTLLKRMAWILEDGRIVKVFYPVFPPDRNAAEVVAWLQASR
ncbi:MAG: peroxiredoxin [Pseudolabrys sp.]|nr:peroxiredoxin [Pseudolabrys sp.]